MRIAAVSPNLPSPAMPLRGVRHDEQLRGFAAAGHQVRGIVPLPWSIRSGFGGIRVPTVERDTHFAVTHPRYARLPVVWRGGPIERSLFVRAATAGLDAWAGSAPIDVVLLHSALLPGGLVGRRRGTRYVVSLYDHEIYDLAPASIRSRQMIAETLSTADCAVYLSQALRREGIALAGPHRSLVIPLGIEAADGLVAEWPDQFTICSVARLIPRKRIDRLIKAFARLTAEHPRARLVIVGDGPERGRLERLVAALGVKPKVEFTGALDARTTRERMARASVMALPSVRESLGAVYLEAMSLGVPSLGTRGEGIEEHITHGKNGILVPPDDDDALLIELRALAGDSGYARRLGEAGKRYFASGPFSWQANVDSFLDLFRELADESKQP
ncbi:MAG TPA: glycosyltransferase [Gemmatimonadales bacterium]|nr:glycosyltransferase [Gemmatimonadales bacterium]